MMKNIFILSTLWQREFRGRRGLIVGEILVMEEQTM